MPCDQASGIHQAHANAKEVVFLACLPNELTILRIRYNRTQIQKTITIDNAEAPDSQFMDT